MPRFDEDDLPEYITSLPEYQIDISDRANMEIDSLYLTKMRYGQRTAEKWYAGLFRAFNTIAYLPRGFALAPDSDKMGGNVRQMIYGSGGVACRILYIVLESEDQEPNTVRILYVRNAAQRYFGESDDE